MAHNYDAQRRETFETFDSAPPGWVPEAAVVDYLFFVEELDANWDAFEKALRAKGFRTSRDDDGETLIASFGPIAVTAASVWEHEEIATRVALAHDFYPDGWDLGLADAG